MFFECLIFFIVDWVNVWVDVLVINYGDLFCKIFDILLWVIVNFEGLFCVMFWWLLLVIVVVIVWYVIWCLLLILVIIGLLFLVGVVGFWDKLMQIFVLMLVVIFILVLIGIFLGIFVVCSNCLCVVLMLLLDIMQIMFSFVYLILVLMLFGLGKVLVIFVIVIYVVLLLICFIDLGICQVDSEVMEVVNVFGVNCWQQLFGVQLLLVLLSIMVGINQIIMMVLLMVVIVLMIGVCGFGEDVLVGIQMLNVGKGLEVGLVIVIFVVVIDCIIQVYGCFWYEMSK